jgi:hypothetical protein
LGQQEKGINNNMKIFEVLQEADERTGAEKLSYMANISRSTGAKLSGKDVANMVGRSTYGNLDPEEVLQRSRQQRSSSAQAKIDQDIADQRQSQEKRDSEEKKQAVRTARDDIRRSREEKRDAEREASKDKDKKQRRSRIQKADDQGQNYRKDAAGRTLRAPRYYGKNDSRGKERSAIKKGLDRLTRNPVDSIADFYIDKVDSLKDFLNSEYS